MKVLHLPTWFPDAGQPISGLFTQKQIAAISRHDHTHQHIVIPLTHQFSSLFSPVAFLRRLLKRQRVQSSYEEGYTIYRLSFFISHPFLFGSISKQLYRQIEQFLKKQELSFDLIHAHVTYTGGTVAQALAAKQHIPYIISEHMSPFPFPAHRKPAFFEKNIASPMRNAEAVVAVSTHQQAEITQHVPNCSNRFIIPNIIDIDPLFRPESPRKKGSFQLVSTGMLNTNAKGIDILIQAVQQLAEKGKHSFHVHVIGDGALSESLQKLSRDLGVSDYFTWHGMLSNEQTLAQLKGCDAYICASRHESFGVAVVEALAYGKPIIATDCGGTRDTINGKNGRLVANENSSELAKGIAWMLHHLSDFDPAAIMKEVKQRYSSVAVANQYLKLYDSTAK